MTKWLSNILIIIGIVLCVIFLQHKFFPTIIDESIHTSDTIYQDTGKVVYVPQPYPIFVDTSRIDTVILPVDSAAIVAEYLALHQKYYSTYHYEDTLVDDSTMYIKINSEISQNKPLKYYVDWYDRTPTVINNTTNIYRQNEFYLGLDIGNQELSANLLFLSKKGYIFGVGYDPLNKTVQAKGYININKLKLW
jgi:hypothetical protein